MSATTSRVLLFALGFIHQWLSRPQSWAQYFENNDLKLYLTSGQNSPNERQYMLSGEGAHPTRPVFGVESVGASSSSGLPPNHSQPIFPGSMPSYHLRDPPEPFPSSGPENGSCNRTPRAPPYKSITSSPLNPSLPSGPPAFDILSPFARAGPHSAPRIKRIPSEESRALSITPPFASNPSRPRGSMILYRTADAQDDHRAPDAQDLLAPPLAYKRNSIGSVDSAVSLWSDSKYPVGTASERRGLVAYAWDPLEDDNEPNDEDDLLHDPAGKMMHDSGRPMSLRGIVNFTAIILLLCALLSLFVVYPVYSFYHSNGLEALIVGNTRINSTGQASSAPFDPRSQIPLTSLTAWIDPATPQDVLTRTGKDGVMYDIVFSDEFNIDDRSFYEDADPVWEAADDQLHDPRLVTTRNGYLILESRNVPLGGRSKGVAAHLSGLLHQRTAVCLHGGFVEIAVASPSSSGDEHFVRMGVWDAEVDDASLSATSLLQLAIDPGSGGGIMINYVRFYQMSGMSSTSCENTQLENISYSG